MPRSMETTLLLRIHALSHPALDLFFSDVSRLGDTAVAGTVAALSAAALWLRSRRREAALAAATAASAWALSAALRPLLHRPRPQVFPGLAPARGFSMPSGHALMAAALFPVLAALAGRAWPRRRRFHYALSAAAVVLVSFSRLYLGVHWPTDVLAGLLLGGGLALAGLGLLDREPRGAVHGAPRAPAESRP